MQLRLEQLSSHLDAGSLAPLYFVHGDELLLVQEACDAIRARARSMGYSEREVFNVDRNFDWNSLRESAGSLSLFAEQRILELRMPDAKPGDAGGKALREYAADPPPDTLMLIISGKLEQNQRNSKWVKELSAVGCNLQIWSVDRKHLPAWIRGRMQARGLRPTADAVEILADRVEGNLLAAAQEIDKLGLMHTGEVDADAIAAGVADSARYNVFAFLDAALAGDAGRSLRMLNGLRAEGVVTVVILAVLAREVRSLAAMAAAMAAGTSAGAVMGQARVWESRKPVVSAALQRHRVNIWRNLLQRCARIDRVAKGQQAGNAWDELIQLTHSIAGSGAELPDS